MPLTDLLLVALALNGERRMGEAQREMDERLRQMLSRQIERLLEAEQHPWEPWKVVLAGAAAGAGLVFVPPVVTILVLYWTGSL